MSVNNDYNFGDLGDNSSLLLRGGAFAALVGIAYPNVVNDVGHAVGSLSAVRSARIKVASLWTTFSNIATNVTEAKAFCTDYIQSKIDKIPGSKNHIEQAKKIIGLSTRIAWIGLKSIDEFLDIAAETKVPINSIQRSLKRLECRDPSLAKCFEFLTTLCTEMYLDNEQEIIDQICEQIYDNEKFVLGEEDHPEDFGEPNNKRRLDKIKTQVYSKSPDLVTWFIKTNHDLIAETIKANILNIAANLADEAYKKGYRFEDRKRNPIGRIFSVLINVYNSHKENLDKIALLPEENQPLAYKEQFENLSSELLAKCFPRGKNDLQLFHPLIPFIHLLKDFAWAKINSELPLWLERLYNETRPINEDWKNVFNSVGYGIKADALMELPSDIINSMIRRNRGKALDFLEPLLEKYFTGKGYNAEEVVQLSHYFHLYVKEFFLTEDTSLLSYGNSIQRYFMERLIGNFSLSFVDGENPPSWNLICKEFIEGGSFSVIKRKLSGKHIADAEVFNSISPFLKIFGLMDKEKFPLPPILKSKGTWGKIDDFLHGKLPPVLMKNISTWKPLARKGINQDRINDLFDDTSLTALLSKKGQKWGGSLVDLLKMITSMSTLIKSMSPSTCFAEDQKTKLDAQWKEFLDDKETFAVLRKFGSESFEGLLFHAANELYSTYEKERALEDVYSLFADEHEEIDENHHGECSSFAGWMFSSLINVSKSLQVSKLSEEEKRAFVRLVELEERLIHPESSELEKKDKEEFDKVWLLIKPKFDLVLYRILKLFGWNQQSDLPFAEKLQSKLWNVLENNIPLLLFSLTGKLITPILEKEKLEEKVRALPEGQLMLEGCRLLAQDVVSHMPEWTEGKISGMLKKCALENPDLKLTQKGCEIIALLLKDIINEHDPVYRPLWEWVESHLEILFLKYASHLGELNSSVRGQLHSLIKSTHEKLLAIEEDFFEVETESEEGTESNDEISSSSDDDCSDFDSESEYGTESSEAASSHSESSISPQQKVLAEFTDQFFKCIGIKTAGDLYGIPSAFQGMLFTLLKQKCLQSFMNIYELDQKVRYFNEEVKNERKHLSLSDASRSFLALTRFLMDRVTDRLSEPHEGGVRGVAELYSPLNLWLTEQSNKNYKTADLLMQAVEDGIPTEWLKDLFVLFDHPASQSYKEHVANWINPVITGLALKHLSQLLNKEKEGQAAFDQSLLMAVLPALTHHIKTLNIAGRSESGLSYSSYIDALGSTRHPAVPPVRGVNEKEEAKQKADHFYTKQAELIFQLIFPNGKEDIKQILPDLIYEDKQILDIEVKVKQAVASQLPEALAGLFDKETLVVIFKNILESTLENLDEPIHFETSPEVIPSAEEAAFIISMDQQLGELFVEGAKFLDLPVMLVEKMPVATIGASVRKKFNGTFLGKVFPEALATLEDRKHIKRTATEKAEIRKQEEARLIALEKQVIEKLLSYSFRYLGERIAHATDVFKNPTLRFIRSVVLTASWIVTVKVLGAFLRLIRLDRLVVTLLYESLRHRIEKSLKVFSQPELQEDFLYHATEAVENLLTDAEGE